MIYLDNAATSFPKPVSVSKSVTAALTGYSANPGRGGHSLSLKASEAVYAARKRVKELFNASREENVIFCSNCTTALNTVIKGVLRPGDHIICSNLEHNAVLRPLNKLKNQGIEYDTASVFAGDFAATRNSFEALIKNNTKLIICTHASNVFGAVLPIEEIGTLCREYGILFAVDSAQTAGVLPIDMQKMGIDFLCVAPHKGLYAPMGTGILIAEKEIGETLIEGGTGSISNSPYQPDFLPDKFESGTANLLGIAGISAGIDFIKSKVEGRIYSSELRQIRHCYDSLSRFGKALLYTPRPIAGFWAPLLSFNIAGMPSEEVAERLNSFGIATRAGLHCAPLAHKTYGTEAIGTVRICPSVFTKDNEIDFFVNKVKMLAK